LTILLLFLRLLHLLLLFLLRLTIIQCCRWYC
jgi:hypothetical protein